MPSACGAVFASSATAACSATNWGLYSLQVGRETIVHASLHRQVTASRCAPDLLESLLLRP